CTSVPGTGAHAVVFAAAGDGVVVDLALVIAPAMAAGLGELGATATVDPHRTIAAAPVAAFDALGLGQLPHQCGATPAGVADTVAPVIAFATDRSGVAVPVAVRVATTFGELGATATS